MSVGCLVSFEPLSPKMLLSTLLLFCTLCAHSPLLVTAYFGQPLSHGVDDLFDVMGQTTIEQWDINDGNVVMNIQTEKVIGEDEIWVLDFQAYEMANGSTPVDTSVPPQLLPGNTGTCSNIFADAPDFYKDGYNPLPPGSKALFNSFTKGTPSGGRRFDNYTYTGDVDTILECENAQSERVWVHNVHEDYIEFNTTLYMTNVRPKYINKPVVASYIESYAVLYWRLLRVALSRFLISSTERLRPLFQYAIVSTVYVDDDVNKDVDRSRAMVDLVFKTVTDSDGELISVYRYGSLVYTSPNIKNSLSHIKQLPTRGCSATRGVYSDGIVSDESMTASSALGGFPASDARLDESGFWAPSSVDTDPWLQIHLAAGPVYVAGVITQGSKDDPNYVTTYDVRYSLDGATFTSVGTFNGNFDSSTWVINEFDLPVLTSYVRIYPLTSLNDIALRVELLGCSDEGDDPNHFDLEYTQLCDFDEYPGQCTQLWQFVVVLNVDEGSVSNNMPIDATGNFQFRYETYRCTNVTSRDPASCEALQIPDAIISHEITLQSTVQLTDAEKDSPWLLVKQVFGDDPNVNLVGGYRPGVSHLETVTIDIEFYPDFLRAKLGLELTLFMVCIGIQYNQDPDGCLAAPDGDRYAAYIDPAFSFTMSTGAELLAENIDLSSQTLSSYAYDWDNELYRITFINKALSALTRDYTITTVFRLIERSNRRRREIAADIDLRSDRLRRDLETNAKKSHIRTMHLLHNGCPATAVHDPNTLDCVCKAGDEFSKKKYDCVLSEAKVAEEANSATTTKRTPLEKDQSPAAVKPDDNIKESPAGSASVATAVPIFITVLYSFLGMCSY